MYALLYQTNIILVGTKNKVQLELSYTKFYYENCTTISQPYPTQNRTAQQPRWIKFITLSHLFSIRRRNIRCT